MKKVREAISGLGRMVGCRGGRPIKITRDRRLSTGGPDGYDQERLEFERREDRLERWHVEMPDGRTGSGPTVEDAKLEATGGLEALPWPALMHYPRGTSGGRTRPALEPG